MFDDLSGDELFAFIIFIIVIAGLTIGITKLVDYN